MADRPEVPMNPQIIEEFRANGGKVGGPFKDATRLLLHTTGAKSGKEHVNPAHPRAHIEIGMEAYDVEVRELPSDERDAGFGHVVKSAPGFGEYQTNTNRVIPVFELRKV